MRVLTLTYIQDRAIERILSPRASYRFEQRNIRAACRTFKAQAALMGLRFPQSIEEMTV
jgi:hypothetical protein